MGRAVSPIRAPGGASGNGAGDLPQGPCIPRLHARPSRRRRIGARRGGAAVKRAGGEGTWLFNPGMRELSAAESDRRAAAGEPFVLRFRVPRDRAANVCFRDAVYGEQIKSTADIEDFALLRSNGMPTYHLASCADDADLRISHIIRGQDHLTNTFKHVLIFEAAGA